MKKILIIGLALIMCMGMVFAADSTWNNSSLVLKTTVSGNGTITDPSNPNTPGEDNDGPDFDDDNLVGFLYWEPIVGASSHKYNLGASSAVGLNPISDKPSNWTGFDLDGTAQDEADSVVIYVYTGSNIPEGGTPNVTVKYSSLGWILEGENPDEQPNIPLSFKSETQNVQNEEKSDDIITVVAKEAVAASGETPASQEINFTADAVTNTNGSSYLTAKTVVTWPQNTKPQAGNYTAAIAIEITAN